MNLVEKIDFNFNNSNLKNYKCHISLLNAGNMKNTTSSESLKAFLKRQDIDYKSVISATQKHSKKILIFNNAKSYPNTIEADGVLTQNKTLIPAVLVSDCMPIFLVDKSSGVFGVLHSGWRGTGIAVEAINILCEKFGAQIENIHFVLGPHIRKCCYNVDAERAKYFCQIDKNSVRLSIKKLFSKWCYQLSLVQANITLLKKAGIPQENIFDTGFCTYCTKMAELNLVDCSFQTNATNFAFGSNRRENPKGKNPFTHMLAYITAKTF